MKKKQTYTCWWVSGIFLGFLLLIGLVLFFSEKNEISSVQKSIETPSIPAYLAPTSPPKVVSPTSPPPGVK
ncbi:hypothetical protein HYV57_00020 [Candidatus Peregrinibacteria bacterium]|nr:hypothetical protein [Candidatus Peregrinibacteria bacterium]